jgi:hypothetical protein
MADGRRRVLDPGHIVVGENFGGSGRGLFLGPSFARGIAQGFGLCSGLGRGSSLLPAKGDAGKKENDGSRKQKPAQFHEPSLSVFVLLSSRF